MSTIKNRKTVHLGLFIFIVVLQLLILGFWYSQYNTEKDLKESLQNPNSQNLAFVYSNAATKSYFDAENYFVEYLHTYKNDALYEYRNSLNKMTVYLDSLNQLVKEDKYFSKVIENKENTEMDIIGLRKQLDVLIKTNIHEIGEKPADSFVLTKYNYIKVLNSIVYDSIRVSDDVIKRGLLSRIGNAISGKYPIQREELQIYIQMDFGPTKKHGTIEEQMKNIFLSTDKYYSSRFGELQNTYSNLREKDRKLMEINKKILNTSQEILFFYTKSAQESNKMELENAISHINNRKNLVVLLICVLAISTIFLLIYTLYAYHREDELSQAKIAAENNLEFKNRLIGMLSHEMRAPLSIISNLTNRLKAKNTDLTLSGKINLLHFTSNSLQITVNQILDFFKNENATLVLYNSKLNLQEEITSILQSLTSLAEAKNIALVSKIDPNLANEVWADKGKIHQLFYNIIGNAIKFTNKGNITVTSNLLEVGDKYKLDVKISDTGVGIPKEDLGKVFDKYYQSKFYKEQVSFGAGLGLHLCKEIVELYDGEIAIDSEIGKGTEITFHLFLEKPNSAHMTSKSLLINRYSDRKMNIAIVDDDPMTLATVKKLVSKINFTATAFASADAIQNYLEHETVDGIITDLQIADKSGIQLVKDIKMLKNRNSKVPIIAITGDNYMDTVNLSELQIDEILIKPLNKEEFYSKLLKVLEQ